MKSFFESPLANALLFSIFWALEIFTAKLAFVAGADFLPFTIQSTFLTLFFLTVYALAKKTKQLRTLSIYTILWLFIANAIHMGIGGTLNNAGIQFTSAINAGFLTQFTVVTGILLAWIILKEKMTFAKIISVGMILLGSFFLTTKGQTLTPHIGDILLILACFAWALGGIIIRKMLKGTKIDPDVVTFFRPIAGLPIMGLFILLSPLYPHAMQPQFQVDFLSLQQLHYVILNAIFITFTWIFVNRTLKVASASYTAILPSITPILVAILAMVFLHERIDTIQFGGIILILTASYLAHYLEFDKH